MPGQESEKRQVLFNNIAPIYDELNNKLSFGQHWVWKRMAVKWSGARPGQRVLDVCCGSGDLSFLLAQAVGPQGQVRPPLALPVPPGLVQAGRICMCVPFVPWAAAVGASGCLVRTWRCSMGSTSPSHVCPSAANHLQPAFSKLFLIHVAA